MSDPYRPAYYPPPATAGSPYHPQDYADASDQYGPLTTRHRPNHSGAGSGSYYPSQTQLTHSSRRDSRDDDYLSPERSHRRKSKSRHSRHHSSDSDNERDRGSRRERSHSRFREAGATAAGGAAGALVGHKIGHGNIGTLAGLAVGALGARALEQQYEKREDRKRTEEPFDGRRDGRPGTRERRKSFVEQAQEKVSGFLGIGDGKDQRRSRSHVDPGRRGGRGGRYEDSDSEDDDYNDRYDRRSRKGDRYGGSSGRSRRDDY